MDRKYVCGSIIDYTRKSKGFPGIALEIYERFIGF
jgi:hypothetical protein